MTRILLTNDDGIHSDGLGTLERALRELGDIYVVAPAAEMSGASHSLTLGRPLRIRQIDARHWTVDGTPTDCVTLALHKILEESERPHVCVSGINHGGNLGDDATYSGTVAGALEATILGV
ncbi:MAG TPA: 5'/3'-nucleotidase SurE, partial [Pyrinomonadaceae bacterium]|nr:5'/3'-nucleotidase SurE [Pyrinomonadaceae bacterium]